MNKEKNMALLDHLSELRKVLIVSAYAIAFGVVVGWFLSTPLFDFLTHPVSGLQAVRFVTTSITEPIMVKLKVSLVGGVVIASPVVVWQIWSFVLPALKKNERRFVFYIAPFSLLLFLAGMAFAFYVVLPVGIRFLLFVNSGVTYEPLVTQSSYFSFLLTFLISFGVSFELPIALLIAVRLGILSPKWLRQKRKYAVIIIFVVVAIISPTPDIPSQILMAGPIYLLYEVSIWLSYLSMRNAAKSKKLLEEGML